MESHTSVCQELLGASSARISAAYASEISRRASAGVESMVVVFVEDRRVWMAQSGRTPTNK